MALEFLTHDSGFLAQLNQSEDFTGTGALAAVLVTTTHTPDRAADVDYEDIVANEADDADYDPVAITGAAITLEGTRIRFDCAKITFTAEGDITGRYVYLVYGTAASLVNGDLILGHIDLTGSGNASSTNAEFSFTPNAAGLFEILRTAAPA